MRENEFEKLVYVPLLHKKDITTRNLQLSVTIAIKDIKGMRTKDFFHKVCAKNFCNFLCFDADSIKSKDYDTVFRNIEVCRPVFVLFSSAFLCDSDLMHSINVYRERNIADNSKYGVIFAFSCTTNDSIKKLKQICDIDDVYEVSALNKAERSSILTDIVASVPNELSKIQIEDISDTLMDKTIEDIEKIVSKTYQHKIYNRQKQILSGNCDFKNTSFCSGNSAFKNHEKKIIKESNKTCNKDDTSNNFQKFNSNPENAEIKVHGKHDLINEVHKDFNANVDKEDYYSNFFKHKNQFGNITKIIFR
ncbi:hypothetical protein EDEG_01218 [Edhazardia aedis USNM 41457]|uniref:Uncharacterized protein n=1 Tax=Edhazardia aedis (strain USNM 41457) TaxID=1003232 RepID=J9DAR8_EDHAE|nr:hypothetical protein EDEG_01218 [Edhazardia aedis USNM 41457]|eukprot:EJW04569.1 hypothetical protein EDEG_01218 [Edhazardia aedis USNM 41457]